MKRSYLIGIIVVVLIGGAAAVYFAWPRASVTVGPSTGATLPVAGQGSSSGSFSSGGALGTGATSSTTPVTARLVEISPGPVVPGESVTDIPARNASSSPDVHVSYIERESGNVFSYSKDSGNITRINNKTIPGIQSAAWSPDGSVAFVRYLSGTDFSTIHTYALSATSSDGFFLPQNLSDIDVSARGVLMVSSGSVGSSVSLSSFDGARTRSEFFTPLSQIQASFAGKNEYLVFTRPAAALSGAAYLVSSAGNFSRIAGKLNGLTALASPSGKWALVSYVGNGSMRMMLVNTATAESVPLPIATITDKCVWSSDETVVYCAVPQNPDSSYTYPDDWYQGVAHFSDRIWKIDVSGRFTQMILDFPALGKGTLDAEALSIDPSGTTLVFVNKNDGSLWSYSL